MSPEGAYQVSVMFTSRKTRMTYSGIANAKALEEALRGAVFEALASRATQLFHKELVELGKRPTDELSPFIGKAS